MKVKWQTVKGAEGATWDDYCGWSKTQDVDHIGIVQAYMCDETGLVLAVVLEGKFLVPVAVSELEVEI